MEQTSTYRINKTSYRELEAELRVHHIVKTMLYLQFQIEEFHNSKHRNQSIRNVI